MKLLSNRLKRYGRNPPPLPSLKSNLAFMWTIENFISKIQFQSLQFNFVLLSMISFNQCHKEIKVICMLLIIRLERWRDVKTTYLGFHIIWRPNFQPSTVSTLTSQILMKWYSLWVKNWSRCGFILCVKIEICLLIVYLTWN